MPTTLRAEQIRLPQFTGGDVVSLAPDSVVLALQAGTVFDTNVHAAAAIDWTKISKAGSSLADLITRDAGDLTGTLLDARLSGNVPLLSAANVFTGGPQWIAAVDPGLHLQMTTNPNLGVSECYVAGFGYDAAGVNQKIGALAFNWTDTANANGYAAWNIHSSHMVAGVQTDDVWLAGWGAHGAAFFPPSIAAASAPGVGVLKINGALTITGRTTGQDLVLSQTTNGLASVLAIRNPNAGTAAGTRFQIGNNAAAFAFTIDVYGTTHATLPGVANFINQGNGDLNMGGWGTTAVAMGAAGAVKLPAYTAATFVAGDKYLVVDAAGNVHRSALGPAS